MNKPSTQNDEIKQMERAIDEGFAESERDLKDKKTPFDKPTQNDWAGRLTLFVNDAWSRGSNWAMKGFGYANDTNADREAELAIELVNNLLADARKEVWVDVDDDCPHAWVFINDSKSLRLCPICNKTQVLATLREEES